MGILNEKIEFRSGRKSRATATDTIVPDVTTPEKEITKRYLKSGTRLDDKELGYLARKRTELVNAEISLEKDYYKLQFNIEGLNEFEHFIKLEEYEKYALLENAASLEELSEEYTFDLDPENLYYTMGLQVKVLERNAGGSKDFFLDEYKALIAHVIKPEYSYKDYLQGGSDLFGSDGILHEILKAGNTEAVKDILSRKCRSIRNGISENYEYVLKSKQSRNKKIIPALLILLAVALAFGIYGVFIKAPFSEKLLEANEHYIKGEYVEVLETLDGVKQDKIPAEIKFIAAKSAIATEGFTAEQKKNLNNSISVNSSSKILNYWLYIGENQAEEAVDMAKQLNDNELICYALIKQKSEVSNDTHMSGDEKETKIEELDQEIEQLTESLNKLFDEKSAEEQALDEVRMEKAAAEENDSNSTTSD